MEIKEEGGRELMEREKDERAQKRKRRSQLGLGVRLRVSVRRRTNKKNNRMLVDATQREEGNKKKHF